MRTDNYKDFAVVYDEATRTNNDEKIALFKKLIERYPPTGNKLLELGCGTGTILQAFQDGYDLTGLDLSQNMLDIAAQKVPSAKLIQADITDFDLGQEYDIILCIFDTINHLLDFAEWEQALRLAAKHLADDGLFIFDINTVSKLEGFVKMQTIEQDTASGHFKARVRKLRPGVYGWDMELGGQVIDVPEAAFPIEKVASLARKHFKVAEILTGDSSPVTEEAGKVFFACRKH